MDCLTTPKVDFKGWRRGGMLSTHAKLFVQLDKNKQRKSVLNNQNREADPWEVSPAVVCRERKESRVRKASTLPGRSHTCCPLEVFYFFSESLLICGFGCLKPTLEQHSTNCNNILNQQCGLGSILRMHSP